ncbi:50S ribosomal protein L17 [Columbia Basin potato purple top phytoplasma]|uniref:Large ribosomal subunit protein bL17 n=1 Tax=Columbia Basin potato purple top phytoplasma TaxID=307134 RepID=A0ABT5L8S3_9MOLU|nr:50S ribosomal protein L17 [Columbia Basin potato purple top phytoplasma]MDC9031958.1 50S ribosomal protein L17 [Columbia Basin potato purple top phytoplasma]
MAYSKLRCDSSHRKSLLKNLVASLIINERIFTTESRAKEVRKVIDKLITLSKKNTLNSKRLASTFLFNKKIDSNTTVLKKLFQDISPKYKDRISGYTRIIKSECRRGDSAPMAFILFV